MAGVRYFLERYNEMSVTAILTKRHSAFEKLCVFLFLLIIQPPHLATLYFGFLGVVTRAKKVLTTEYYISDVP